MKNVTEVMAERLSAAGLEVPEDSPAHRALAALVPALDTVLPTVAEDPHSLRLLAEALRSYADVAEDFAAEEEQGAADELETASAELRRLGRESYQLAEMIVDLREQGERRRLYLHTVLALVEQAERDGEAAVPTEKLRRAVDGPPQT